MAATRNQSLPDRPSDTIGLTYLSKIETMQPFAVSHRATISDREHNSNLMKLPRALLAFSILLSCVLVSDATPPTAPGPGDD
jgi:hypothetical protein